MLSMSELKLGTIIDIDNHPYQITYTQHVKVARGGASLKTKLKNLVTGQALERTFSGGDKIQAADLQRQKANFLYKDETSYYFMNNETFEQFDLTNEEVGFVGGFLPDGITVDTLIFNDKPVSIKPPTKVELRVTEAPPGIKGDTAGSASKMIILETGIQIKAPLFINKDEIIRVNTETGEYVERA